MFPSIYTKLLCEQEILWVPGKSSRSSSSSKDSSWVGKWPCLILRNPRQGDWQIGIKMANPPGGVENFYVMKSRGQNGWSPKLYIKAEGLFREYDKDHSKTTGTSNYDLSSWQVWPFIRADCYILQADKLSRIKRHLFSTSKMRTKSGSKVYSVSSSPNVWKADFWANETQQSVQSVRDEKTCTICTTG